MRRKISQPFARGVGVRPLRPAPASSWLTTAASLAVVLAGCSTPTLEGIAPDPATAKTVTAPAPAPSPAPSTSASAFIEPDPGDVDGEIPYVKPTHGK
jgi:hypothetical protein